MESENENNGRRKFLKFGLLAGGATIASIGIQKNLLSEEKPLTGKKVKVLTADGHLVEVDSSHVEHHAANDPYTAAEIRQGVEGRKFIRVIDLSRCANERKCVEGCQKAHKILAPVEYLKVKRMQDSLKDQRAWFHSIIESAPDAMLVTDEKGNIILCNSRAAEIFNYDSRELHSLNIKQLVVDDKGICKDGRHFPADVSVNDLPNLNNGGVCHCVLVRDITKRMRIENDIRHAKKLAETANQMKSDFLANMSHELRTPLNAIIGYSEILQEDAEDIGQPEFVLDLKRIHGAGKHLLKLINDILDLSKIEAGKMDIYLEEVNLENVISETRDIVLPLMVKNNNQFVIENALCFKKMYTDVTKVKQTLFNLIGNAAKFTHNGVITLSIKDYLLDDKEHVSFSVHDTGIGLTAEQMEKLFTDFVQADTSTTRKYGGSGLGLAISRRFCQMLGGDIIVNSAINKGSTFTIDLPMNIQQNQPSNLRSKIDE